MPLSPAVAYAVNQDRLDHLLVSLASWKRFVPWPVAVVDLGLKAEGRRAIEAVAGGQVTFLPPAPTAPLPDFVVARQRAYAFEQKTLLGSRVVADPIVYLDSDILVTHPSFLPGLAAVRPEELLASPSAWDADFTWTYTPESLPWLRTALGRPDLGLRHRICNSGVWAMRRSTAGAVSPRWHTMFRAALDAPQLRATLRPGTEIGDQEFLVPACAACGVSWARLHGSFNMQVHERRMPWAASPTGHPLGGHPDEPPEAVRAIHYGCAPDGTVVLEDGMIASPALRAWITEQYRACWHLVQRRGKP